MGHGRKSTEGLFVWMLLVARCESCNGVLVYQIGWDQYGEAWRSKTLPVQYLVWPRSGALQFPTPEHIQELHANALLLKVRSPEAFAVQMRRALEAVCHDRGQSGSLNQMLRALKEAGQIPASLSALGDVVRLTGNSGAHAGGSVTTYQTDLIERFLRMIVEYIYVAPHLLQSFEISVRANRKNTRSRVWRPTAKGIRRDRW